MHWAAGDRGGDRETGRGFQQFIVGAFFSNLLAEAGFQTGGKWADRFRLLLYVV